MKILKGILVFVLCFVFVFSVFTGCSGSDNNAKDKTEAGTTQNSTSGDNVTTAQTGEGTGDAYFPLGETAEISAFGQGFWAPMESPIVYEDMLKLLNIKVNWNCPSDGYYEKKDIALATKDISDLMWIPVADAMKYGLMGAFVDMSKYLDKMPNFKKFIAEVESSKYGFMTAEGNIFCAPKNTNNDLKSMFFLYNTEKFAEWNLSEPKNLDEIYDAAKKIKAINSKYYPVAGFINIPQNDFYTVLKAVMNSMGIGDDADANFFIKEDKYKYTPLIPAFKDAVAYVKRLFDEGLISPEYLTMDYGKSRSFWADTDGSSEMYDNFVSFIGTSTPANTINIQRMRENSEYLVQSGAKKYHTQPPVMEIIPGENVSMTEVVPIIPDVNSDWIYATSVAIDARAEKDPKKLELLLNLVDWMYSDQAKALFNYGREGLHYDIADGKAVIKDRFVNGTDLYRDANFVGGKLRKIYDDAGWDYTKVSLEDRLQIWGFYTAYSWMPFNQCEEFYGGNLGMYPSKTIMNSVIELNNEKKKTATILGKKPMPFNLEESKKANELLVASKDYCLQEVDKFIMGKRSMDEWDAFIRELKAKGALELENLYNSTYSYKVKK